MSLFNLLTCFRKYYLTELQNDRRFIFPCRPSLYLMFDFKSQLKKTIDTYAI